MDECDVLYNNMLEKLKEDPNKGIKNYINLQKYLFGELQTKKSMLNQNIKYICDITQSMEDLLIKNDYELVEAKYRAKRYGIKIGSIT
jgi:hypothetical protein